MYIKLNKNWPAKYYQKIQQDYKTSLVKSMKIFLIKKKKKSGCMVVGRRRYTNLSENEKKKHAGWI